MTTELKKKTPEERTLDAIGWLVSYITGWLVFIPTYLFRGYVVMVLWGWFITPVFGKEPPAFILCAGLVLFFQSLRFMPFEYKEDISVPKKMWVLNVVNYISSATCLFVGWLLHLFM